MSVKVIFDCDGCTATAEGTQSLRSRFEQVTPLTGYWHPFRVEDAAPEGWVPSDPYTGCCYCPDCWRGIEQAEPPEDDDAEAS